MQTPKLSEYISKLSNDARIDFYMNCMEILADDTETDKYTKCMYKMGVLNEPIEKLDDEPFCKRCICPMVVNESEAMSVCMCCGHCLPVLIFLQDYKDMNWERQGYAYKRITHFRHHFRKLQKKLGMVRIDHLQERMELMFNAIQSPFLKHKPNTRRNFFSYSYIFKKMFEIMRQPELSKELTYLKSKEKLKAHDDIWIKICEDKGWEFIPSKRAVEHKRTYKKRKRQ